MRDDRERLRDILDAIEKVERHAGAGREQMEANELVFTWVVYQLQVIGEAANSISNKTQQMAPGIPWRQIVAMRNMLIHGYFGIKIGEVWKAVERDLPPLKRDIETLLRDLE